MTLEDIRMMQLGCAAAFIAISVIGLFSIWTYKIGWDKGFESGYTAASPKRKKQADQEAALEARMHADMDAKAMLMAADIPGLDDIDLPGGIKLLDHDSGLNLEDHDFILTPIEDKLKDRDDYYFPLAPDDEDSRLT